MKVFRPCGRGGVQSKSEVDKGCDGTQKGFQALACDALLFGVVNDAMIFKC